MAKSVQRAGSVETYLANELTEIAQEARAEGKLDVAIKAVTSAAKIAGYMDNPKITIIHNQIPTLSKQDLLTK